MEEAARSCTQGALQHLQVDARNYGSGLENYLLWLSALLTIFAVTSTIWIIFS
jgi:hypothetical protein